MFSLIIEWARSRNMILDINKTMLATIKFREKLNIFPLNLIVFAKQRLIITCLTYGNCPSQSEKPP